MSMSFDNRNQGGGTPSGEDLFLVPQNTESYTGLSVRAAIDLYDVLSKARKLGVEGHGLNELTAGGDAGDLLNIAIALVRDPDVWASLPEQLSRDPKDLKDEALHLRGLVSKMANAGTRIESPEDLGEALPGLASGNTSSPDTTDYDAAKNETDLQGLAGQVLSDMRRSSSPTVIRTEIARTLWSLCE